MSSHGPVGVVACDYRALRTFTRMRVAVCPPTGSCFAEDECLEVDGGDDLASFGLRSTLTVMVLLRVVGPAAASGSLRVYRCVLVRVHVHVLLANRALAPALLVNGG